MKRYAYRVVRIGGRVYREHRLIAEEILGRPLRRDEYVHHINEDTKDNRPENLCVVSPAQHRRIHTMLRVAYLHGWVPEGGWDQYDDNPDLPLPADPTSADFPYVLDAVGVKPLSFFLGKAAA